MFSSKLKKKKKNDKNVGRSNYGSQARWRVIIYVYIFCLLMFSMVENHEPVTVKTFSLVLN